MTAVSIDGLDAVCSLLGIQTAPTVLQAVPRFDSALAWRAARETAMHDLSTEGVIRDDEVDSDLACALRTLTRPEYELAARIVSETGTRRLCLACRGGEYALAIRTDDKLEITPMRVGEDAMSLGRPVVSALGPCPPADIASFSAPSDELRCRFDQAATAADYAQALYELAVAERDAIQFGLAMADCHGYAEIVAYTHKEGVTTQARGAVAVYDTGLGRIVATPTRATDHRVWSTFAPGTDYRVAQAIATLIESVPGGRWPGL